MIALVNNAVIINSSTNRRANVIAQRTNNDMMGIVKAQMIDLLKAKYILKILSSQLMVETK